MGYMIEKLRVTESCFQLFNHKVLNFPQIMCLPKTWQYINLGNNKVFKFALQQVETTSSSVVEYSEMLEMQIPRQKLQLIS